MRKKKLAEQNSLLFKELGSLQNEMSRLKKQLADKEMLISQKDEQLRLLAEKEDIPEKTTCREPEMFKTEEKEEHTESIEKPTPFTLSEEMEYASEIIGKIVLCSAEHCNILTENGETRYRELVNLILGKTEVAKADILSLVKSDSKVEEKRKKMNEIKAEAEEYFNNILAQR